MAAPSKRARRVRKAEEFDVTRLAAELSPPPFAASADTMSLSEILDARDQQRVGRFARAALLAESMRTDDALAVAYENRLAPQRCTKVEIVPARGARGRAIAAESEGQFGQDGIAVHPNTLRDINGCLVNHGVAFANVTTLPRPDGTRVDVSVKFWPIRYVRWDPFYRVFKTQIDAAAEEIITHGDGRWIVFQEGEVEPFKNGAILSAAMVWARHAFPLRDWMQGSAAHGAMKLIGEMPEGVALQSGSGLSLEAKAFLELLKAMLRSGLPYGIRPAGSKTEFVTSNSTAWQVWQELVANAEKAAARIYLGTDGVLGSAGGAPGVDISQLFGVALTKVQGDLAAIERGLREGAIEPWTAMNFGDSSLAPARKYLLPDADADASRESASKRRQAFFADVKSARESGFSVDQGWISDLAAGYDIAPPALPAPAPVPVATPAPPTTLRVVPTREPPTPTEIARAVASELHQAAPPVVEPSWAQRQASFLGDLRDMKDAGLHVDQDVVNALAERHGVSAPQLVKVNP